MIFAASAVFVFLVLAAQYESWTLPGAVMSAVALGVSVRLCVVHLALSVLSAAMIALLGVGPLYVTLERVESE